MSNQEFQSLLNKSSFFNKDKSIITNPVEAPQPKKELENLPKLNICSGPNVFPFPGWINYDREDISSYLTYLDWQDEAKTMAYVLHEMPEPQQKLANFIRGGNKIDFRVHDIRKGFAHHADNSVGFIYLGQAIEHLNIIYEVPKFLAECRRILKPGGVLRMTTPDLDLLIQAYINNDMDKFSSEQPEFYTRVDPSAKLAMIMFGSSGEGCTQEHFDGHFFLFTKKSMTTTLKNAGFKDIEFYYEPGKGKDPEMAREVTDFGLTHSFIVESIK